MKRILVVGVLTAFWVGCDPADSGGAGGRGEKGIGGASGSSPAAQTDMGTPGSGSNQNTRGFSPTNETSRDSSQPAGAPPKSAQ